MSFIDWKRDLERRAGAAVAIDMDQRPVVAKYPLDCQDCEYLRALDKAFARA